MCKASRTWNIPFSPTPADYDSLVQDSTLVRVDGDPKFKPSIAPMIARSLSAATQCLKQGEAASALVQSLPLLGGVALGRPSMNSSDLGLEDRVYQAVTGEHGLLIELGGDNDRLESLATATYIEKKKWSKFPTSMINPRSTAQIESHTRGKRSRINQQRR